MSLTYKVSFAVLLAFLVATPAFAASITNIEFSNGDVVHQGTGGSTVDVEFRVVVGAGEVVEQFEVDVLSDNLAPVCESVGGERGLEQGTHFVTRSVKLPPNTGTYDVQAKASGIFGATRSIDCTSDVVDSTTFNDAIRVVGGGTTNTNVGGTNLNLDELKAWILALIQGTQPAPVAEKPACKALADKMVGTVQGSTASGNVRLQGFLLAEGMSIPALEQGAAFGFYGSQTANAVSVYKGVHGCI